MVDKETPTVSATFEILMDYYKSHADFTTPQPIIRDVDVVFKGKYNTLALGRVSLKFAYVGKGYIELRVLTQNRDLFTILVLETDNISTLEITY